MENNDYAKWEFSSSEITGRNIQEYPERRFDMINHRIEEQDSDLYLIRNQIETPSAEILGKPFKSKTKEKDRSKSDIENRNFKCTLCHKTYLSYPALYTHNKTKHPSVFGIGLISGRGRGRPKKNVVTILKNDPSMPEFFNTEGRGGGPTDILEGFQEAYNILYGFSEISVGYQNHPLYLELKKLRINSTILSLKKGEEEIRFSKETTGQPKNIHKPIHKKKCDEIFAEYLVTVAAVTNKEYYKHVVQFMFLFRECMNNYGDYLINTRELGSEPDFSTKKIESAKEKIIEDYCLKYDAAKAPEVTNAFVSSYIDQIHTTLEKNAIIDLTQNLCAWLFENGYTKGKLLLCQGNQ